MAVSLAKQTTQAFILRLDSAISYHSEMAKAIAGKANQASLENILVEQFALNIAILWEVFLSDLIIIYVTMAPRNFSKSLSEEFGKTVKKTMGQGVASISKISFPVSISSSRIRTLVDKNAFNKTFKNSNELAAEANKLLAARYARRFALNRDDAEFFDFLISLRNFLAHRSVASRTKLKTASVGLTGNNVGFNGGFKHIGPYLKFKDTGGRTRSINIAYRIKDIVRLLA